MNLSFNTPLENSSKGNVLDLVPAVIAVHDRDQPILWANKAFISAVGATLDEIVEKKCLNLGSCRTLPGLPRTKGN